MKNDCTNLVNDGLPGSGGCIRCYCSCPYYIRDNMDMGCGGVCYEPPEKPKKKEESKKDGKDKKSNIRNK